MPKSGILRRLVTFADPGRDTWIATIDFGHGSAPQVFDVRGESRLLLKHRYAQPGVHTVTIAITDDDGGIGTSSFQVRGL